ncbi:MAG: pyridoxal phosphate-dependent aminotransferase [Pseudomonadota bacterium]
MSISNTIAEALHGGSWIRRMFEQGNRLKAELGVEKVFDFSLGNPDVPPPPGFDAVLVEEASRRDPMIHAYMTNAGYLDTRRVVAGIYRDATGLDFAPEDVVMTSGAGGAINVILKSLLDPDDEVITFAPYFVEYGFYATNHRGRLITVESTPDFMPDLDALDAAITERTRVVLINSPNNPTGRMYPAETLEALAGLLRRRSEALGRPIYLVSDEPYRDIVYDGAECPHPSSHYDDCVTVTSHSKGLSLAGERIGHLAISPRCAARADLQHAAIFCNRILGFVNANALMQRVVARLVGLTVDVNIYQRRRDMLCDALGSMGYEIQRPEGAFYLYPRSPLPDDTAFCAHLLKQNVIVVPGVGFGRAGHFRISYAVDDKVIERALPAFERAIKTL